MGAGLFGENVQIYSAKTVPLETEWGLHCAYAFGSQPVVEALGRLLGLANVEVEDPVGWPSR